MTTDNMPDEIWVYIPDDINHPNCAPLEIDHMNGAVCDAEKYHHHRIVEAKDVEIERLKERLEIAPDHEYDGIYCRDETIRMQEKEIERLREEVSMLKSGIIVQGDMLYNPHFHKVIEIEQTLSQTQKED